MNGSLAPLLPAALVGTDRHAGTLPSWPGPVGALAGAAAQDAPDPATALLRMAAVLAPCALAGAQAPPPTAPLPPAADEDRLPPLQDPSALAAIGWALREGPSRLHPAACAALGEAGLRWPPALLPLVLDLGRRSVALRPLLAPTLGERGRWLAALRDDWRYAVGAEAGAPLEERWQQGSVAQRCEALAEERRRDPAAARDRLAAALPELPAAERAELVAPLAEGLGPADEPLLDTLRRDRSREVRQAATALLLRLPQASSHVPAQQRMQALLTHAAGGWQVEAPTAAPPAAVPAPRHETLGERAWWLLQEVRLLPLPWWTTHTHMTPVELLAWAARTDWAAALQRGWHEVLLAAPDEAWCTALLDDWPAHLPATLLPAVVALLPRERQERHWLRELQGEAPPPPAVLSVLHRVLPTCPAGQTLPQALSDRLAQALLAAGRGGVLVAEHGLRALLPDLAAALHPQALDTLALLAVRPDDPPGWTEAVGTTAQVIAARRALLNLSSTPPP